MGRSYSSQSIQWRTRKCYSNEIPSCKVSFLVGGLARADIYSLPPSRNLDVLGAKDMLKKTILWRDSFKPEETLHEDFPSNIFGNLGHVSGIDKEGRPVT